jgi:hypothetical protein
MRQGGHAIQISPDLQFIVLFPPLLLTGAAPLTRGIQGQAGKCVDISIYVHLPWEEK